MTTLRLRHRLRGAAVSAICAVCAFGLTVAPAAAAPKDVTISVPGMSTPVGTAADTGNDRYWVTDGRPASTSSLIAVDQSGNRTAKVSWQAQVQHVQALSWAAGSLYVGDIGDPDSSRDSIQVLSPLTTDGDSASWKAWDLGYPDGAHDADAMAVSPKGNIYIITKGPSSAVYRAPTSLSRSGQNRMTKVADAPAGITDAVFLPGGKTVAVRTASQVLVLDAYKWTTKASAPLASSGGDSLSVDLDGKGLLAGQKTAKLTGVDVPTGQSPSATPKASASSASAPSATTGSASSTDQDFSVERWGTALALAGAVVMALVAGVVVHRAGRRR
ncbi:hypothetical protein [Acidipropionibacterium virtanenii]|nr:hypothetical protein [Acidipropionibacterium virtanenii]